MAVKDEKLIELFRNLAAQFISRESNRTSLITVTGASLSDDRKYVTIFLSVYPDDKEGEAIKFVSRQRSEFKEFVKGHARIGKIPFFDFKIDKGEKNRQKIESLLKKSE